jgi:hypothetical protein
MDTAALVDDTMGNLLMVDTGWTLHWVTTGEPMWMKETPTRGTLAANGYQDVTITLDAAAAGSNGVFKAAIHVMSDYPQRPNIPVPVEFKVASE